MRRCIFCEIVAGDSPASRIYEDEDHLAFLDIFPWSAGHALVIPKEHSRRTTELSAGARGRLFQIAVQVGDALRASSIACQDLNFALNDGPAANQSVPHTHVHVLPRVRGDVLRVLAQPLKLPLRPFFGPAPRAQLDAQAAELRQLLQSGSPR